MSAERAVASAPASVGNVAVGFDLLGHSLDGPVDRVTAIRRGVPGVRIISIEGVDGAAALPLAVGANTAGRAVLSLLAAHAPGLGVELHIDKGIPLSAGMGGSAASAVAALVAVNALLPAPLAAAGLYPFALDGEAVASGARHGDNLGPQLLGGLVLATATDLIAIPTPADLFCALAHPDQRLETRRARAVLRDPFPLADVVAQGEGLALVLLGVQRCDYTLIARGLRDHLVEPRRAPLIPGFAAVQQAARDAGALGCSISGAGPSLFAWCRGADAAHAVADAMRTAFTASGSACRTWVSPVAGPAARLEPPQ
jgi:homoserine kinase